MISFRAEVKSGYLYSNPASRVFFGMTFWPCMRTTALSEPMRVFMTKPGTGKMVGLFRIRPSSLVNSWLVFSAGATPLNTCGEGEGVSDSAGRSRAWAMIPARSETWIQGNGCLPDPSVPPRPSQKGSSICFMAPPSRPNTAPGGGREEWIMMALGKIYIKLNSFHQPKSERTTTKKSYTLTNHPRPCWYMFTKINV